MGVLNNNFIADIFYWFLQLLHNVVPNYILVVVLAALIVHVATMPLDYKQRQSTYRMQKLQPKMAAIKARYKDAETQNAKIQELYKKENVKMMAGCLPMIVKMILLFAFFGALTKLANHQIAKLVIAANENPGAVIELPKFLWVKNIFMPDAGNAKIMPTLQAWEKIVNSLSPEMMEQAKAIDYEALIQPTLAHYEGLSNGWYILPILQGVLMYASMVVSMPKTEGVDNPMGGNVMKLVMSGTMILVTVSTNTLFTIYFIFSNLLSTATNMAFNKHFKNKDEETVTEKIVGE